jgi:predicted DNA-binding transcriptional regulator AlpA
MTMHATGTISFLTPRQQAWLEEQQQFVSSGLSAREFCKLHQLSTSTFYKRRERLAELDPRPVTTTGQPAAAFIDAGSIQSFAIAKTSVPDEHPEPVVPTGVEMRIDLGAGIVLTIKRH